MSEKSQKLKWVRTPSGDYVSGRYTLTACTTVNGRTRMGYDVEYDGETLNHARTLLIAKERAEYHARNRPGAPRPTSAPLTGAASTEHVARAVLASASAARAAAPTATHLIVDVTPDRPGARDAVRLACGYAPSGDVRVTRDPGAVTCTACADAVYDADTRPPIRDVPTSLGILIPDAPTSLEILTALDDVISVALDCRERWSRGHPDGVKRAQDVADRIRGILGVSR